LLNGAAHDLPAHVSLANVTLSMAGEDCIAILEGKLIGMSALLSGRLKIAGDMGLAMQLAAFFLAAGASSDPASNASVKLLIRSLP
jgi:putative sterol carrier protein